MNKILLTGIASMLVGSTALSNITTITQSNSQSNTYQKILRGSNEIELDMSSGDIWSDIKATSRNQIMENIISESQDSKFLNGRSVAEISDYAFKVSDELVEKAQDVEFDYDSGALSYFNFFIEESLPYTQEFEEIFLTEFGEWIDNISETKSGTIVNSSSDSAMIQQFGQSRLPGGESECMIPDPPKKPEPPKEPDWTDENVKALEKYVRDLNFANGIIIPLAISAGIAAAALWAMAWFFGITVAPAAACTAVAAALSITTGSISIALLPLKDYLYRPVDWYYLASGVFDIVMSLMDLVLLATGGLVVTIEATAWAFPAGLAALGIIGMIVTYLDTFGAIK
ncbi:hypothetical protein [Spiroplasma alleghenense]|uniref:Transmembrane protein n=1 Tax=Spiroplasma alleghenense TaxID=216931 RepID=A0A345Z5B2_9MOLU|nr:hypothetical protein [Spiroplasma alleghenense]AXK51791.1 hypothetical protein SALLE_v1c11210 [Spiroplasma alleghenense]